VTTAKNLSTIATDTSNFNDSQGTRIFTRISKKVDSTGEIEKPFYPLKLAEVIDIAITIN